MKEHEAQRKRKDMAVKLQQEQQHRNLILAKKKEEQKKAQEKIRERFLKDSPVIPEMDEVEEYIAKTDQSVVRLHNHHCFVHLNLRLAICYRRRDVPALLKKGRVHSKWMCTFLALYIMSCCIVFPSCLHFAM